jgi:hypothetical protein
MKNYEKFLGLGEKLHSSASVSASVRTAIPRFSSASAKFNVASPRPRSKIVPRSISGTDITLVY